MAASPPGVQLTRPTVHSASLSQLSGGLSNRTCSKPNSTCPWISFSSHLPISTNDTACQPGAQAEYPGVPWILPFAHSLLWSFSNSCWLYLRDKSLDRPQLTTLTKPPPSRLRLASHFCCGPTATHSLHSSRGDLPTMQSWKSSLSSKLSPDFPSYLESKTYTPRVQEGPVSSGPHIPSQACDPPLHHCAPTILSSMAFLGHQTHVHLQALHWLCCFLCLFTALLLN